MTMVSDQEMAALVAAISADAGASVARVEAVLADHPDDARLHFVRGSLLIDVRRPIEAHAALTRAVALAPDFALARFQLGFFELTSGEPQRALATWEPLDTLLPGDHFLAHFVTGLRHLIRDEFDATVAALRSGIALNGENLPLNHDMRLIVDQCIATVKNTTEPGEEASATSFLLGQVGRSGTMH